MRISDWSSDVCSSDLLAVGEDVATRERATGETGAADARDGVVEHAATGAQEPTQRLEVLAGAGLADVLEHPDRADGVELLAAQVAVVLQADLPRVGEPGGHHAVARSEEPPSELQSLMR